MFYLLSRNTYAPTCPLSRGTQRRDPLLLVFMYLYIYIYTYTLPRVYISRRPCGHLKDEKVRVLATLADPPALYRLSISITHGLNAREKGEIKIGGGRGEKEKERERREGGKYRKSHVRVSLTNASRSRGRRAIIIHLSNDGSEYRGLSTLVPACLFHIQLFFDLTYASNIVLLDLLQSFISSIINFTKRDYI